MQKNLPSSITSYDLLKTLAVTLMLADHIGYYFFPDDMWWRVVGRLCVPLWFFLIGYARSRDLDRRLLIGGLILIVADYAAGHYFIPLNILFSMLIIRIVLDRIMIFATRGLEALGLTGLVLAVFYPFSIAVFEYGFLGILLAMTGWLLRNRDNPVALGGLAGGIVQVFFGFTYIAFVVLQNLTFEFSLFQMAVLAVGSIMSFWLIANFRPETYPALTERHGLVGAILRFGGRRTLEIYVGHLILFKLLGVLTDPERFQPFTLKWFWIE